MKLRTLAILSALTLTTLAGCAAQEDAPVAESESAAISRSDARIKQELTDALAGLETGGSEGDPDPYKVIDAFLWKQTPMTPERLVSRLLPKMEGFPDADEMGEGYSPSYQASTVEGFFGGTEVDPADYEGDPEGLAAAQAAKAKWEKVRAIVQRNLTDVKALHIGYRYDAGGSYSSIETGAVAITLAGRAPSGRIIAIYGIVIWT